MAITKEFREFIVRGNVVDLAVGVIIGAAFGKIVTSLVNDIIMPPIGLIISGVDFSKAKYVLKAAEGKSPATSINYGAFINNVIDFLIVAFFIFLVVKGINSFRRKEEEAPPAGPVPTRQEELLTEIRDLLAKNRK